MQWYETSTGEDRLGLEVELLEIDYPHMRVVSNDGYIEVRGHMRPELCSDSFYVVVRLPSNYPYGRIKVFLPEEDIVAGTPHLYNSATGELCVEHNDFTPMDTISTFLGWVAGWLSLYENYVDTGRKW